MSAFTLEVVRSGETPVVEDVVTLLEGRAVWRQVEALALQIENLEGAYILVKNDQGETVIRAGGRTVLASICQCPCASCPLKKVLARRSAAESGAAIKFRSAPLPFEKADAYPCEIEAQGQNFDAAFSRH